jgi:hypothetical protein
MDLPNLLGRVLTRRALTMDRFHVGTVVAFDQQRHAAALFHKARL